MMLSWDVADGYCRDVLDCPANQHCCYSTSKCCDYWEYRKEMKETVTLGLGVIAAIVVSILICCCVCIAGLYACFRNKNVRHTSSVPPLGSTTQQSTLTPDMEMQRVQYIPSPGYPVCYPPHSTSLPYPTQPLMYPVPPTQNYPSAAASLPYPPYEEHETIPLQKI